jgi:hypothetical protein
VSGLRRMASYSRRGRRPGRPCRGGQAPVVVGDSVGLEVDGLGTVSDGAVRSPLSRRARPGCCRPRRGRLEADGLGIATDPLLAIMAPNTPARTTARRSPTSTAEHRLRWRHSRRGYSRRDMDGRRWSSRPSCRGPAYEYECPLMQTRNSGQRCSRRSSVAASYVKSRILYSTGSRRQRGQSASGLSGTSLPMLMSRTSATLVSPA